MQDKNVRETKRMLTKKRMQGIVSRQKRSTYV
jgi:hypothetical protein